MSPYKLKEVTSNGVVTNLTTEGKTGAAGSSRASYYFTMPNPPFLNILHTSFNRANEAIAAVCANVGYDALYSSFLRDMLRLIQEKTVYVLVKITLHHRR